jgi:RNA polymerase sigma-70 factor (ECF subfamily)
MESALSFDAVYRQEYSYVRHTLRRLGIRERDLDDLSQEVFLTVHAILTDYDPERPLRPWLFGIAYRHALRHRDKAYQRREQLDSSPGRTEAAAGEPESALQRRQAQGLVLRALDRVHEHRRAVFVMADIDGFSAPEIAHALSIPVNTVYSRLRLARGEFTAAVRRLSSAKGARA